MEKKITTTETSYQLLFKDGRESSAIYHRFLDALSDAKEYKDIAGLKETVCVFYEDGISAKRSEAYLLHGEIVNVVDLPQKVRELGVAFQQLGGTMQNSEYAILAPCGLAVAYGEHGRLLREYYIPDSRK